MAEEAEPAGPTHYANVLPFSFQFTTQAGWTYEATVTALPALVAEKYVQDSPPGEAQLAQWFDGSFTWQVTSLDEGRNAPEHVLLASFSYDAGTSADDTHPDLKIIGEPVMCDPSSGERWVYGCSYDNEAVASSSSSPMLSHRITETQADALVNTLFTEDRALIHVGSPAAGECGVVVDPIAQTIEPNGFSAEKGTCSNLRIG